MRKALLFLSAAGGLASMAACGPYTTGLIGEIENDPIQAIFIPVTAPLAALYDGLHHTVGATPSDVGQVLDGALAIGGVALGVASTMQRSPGGYSPSPYNPSTGTGQIPTPAGYSQVGAFRDCQQVYQAAGRYDLAQQCANNASNIHSLTPVR